MCIGTVYMVHSLENMLRGHLVEGINNEAIQCRLLSETTLTNVKRAVELAQGLEAVAKNMKEIQNGIVGIKNRRPGSSQESQ